MKRVYLCAGDEAGWAVDEDRRLTLAALDGVVRIVDRPQDADIIHSCWWEPLMRLPEDVCAGKPVVCHMAGDPARCLGEPTFLRSMARVTRWVAQSRSATEKMRTVGAPVSYVPYAADTELAGRAIAEASPASDASISLRGLDEARRAGAYVIASFHRDTAGAGLRPGAQAEDFQPKLVKGPDLFAAVLGELRRRGCPVVALLAGPRRHWIRAALAEARVPCVFAGREIDGDDYPANILPREQLAQLYRRADLYLVTSRSEGGPRTLLEACLAGTPVLSTRVGHAPDILAEECLYDDVMGAVEIIEREIKAGAGRPGGIARFSPVHRAVIEARHTVEAVREHWRAVYASLRADDRPAHWWCRDVASSDGIGPARRVDLRVTREARRVSFWNKFTPPPWGGGNQFMMALMNEARRQGVECVANGEGGPGAETGHILNSVQFDIERFESMVAPGSARVLHRIDGPISVLRGTPDALDLDKRCFDLNARYARATIIQSWHTLRFLAAMGFEPVRPALLLNACDPTIFRRGGAARETHDAGGRLRIIATSWSPNPGKGAAIYEWLDRNLDFSRFSVSFVGNCPVKLRNIRVLAPVPSEQLAEILQQHDVYLTASRNDPCSNALIEALACGLPAVYLKSGGHPELTGFGGIGFTRPDELPSIFARIADQRLIYRGLIRTESMSEVCRKYLQLLFEPVAR